MFPRIVPFEFDDGPANSGQDISISCMIPEGDLPLEINWYINSESVEKFVGITTARVGKRNMVLNIESVRADHSGNFTCIAKNKAGSVAYTTELKVFGTQKYKYPVTFCI